MPQESLRSVVYRSFVTCEGPRGVVEGKTIRIPKTDSTTKMGSRKNETQSKSSKEKPSSYQLVEVKNGAIDSWSKRGSFGNQPKDIAKDLLKGALDLQESLMMLGKLQEASCIVKPKKICESFRIYDTGFGNERDLEDGSSRDCYQELREVIRDGLSRQNLLPKKCDQESGKMKLQLSPEIASSSSSRSSSMVYSTHEFTSSESFSSRATEETSKGSNLIAKLMGLEEFPSKTVAQKQINISKTRPLFDLDLPNGKFFARKMDREQVSLDKIIGMMQSKGLLRSKNHGIKETKAFEDDSPPIVLMKPHNQKVKSHVNPVRKLHQEKAKAEEKEKAVKIKQKASVPIKPQRKQEMEKKIDKIQKMAHPIRRKPAENANSVSKHNSVKPQRNPVSKRTSASDLPNSGNQKKNLKIEKVYEVLQTDSTNEEKTETVDSEVMIKEIDNERQQSISESPKEDSHHVHEPFTGISHSKTRNNRKKSGLSDIRQLKARILQTISSFQDSEPASFNLFQDYVNEFLYHVNLRYSNPLHHTSILKSRICISEDQLMKEIAKEVENLRNCGKFSKESCNEDTISGLLERDLSWSTMGGVWNNNGWKDGCTLDEVEELVLDLEKILLGKLIDDMLMELVP